MIRLKLLLSEICETNAMTTQPTRTLVIQAPLSVNFKEHQNFYQPTGGEEHCPVTGHAESMNNISQSPKVRAALA